MGTGKGLNIGNAVQPPLVFLILLSAALFGAVLVFNFLASDSARSDGLFIHGIGNVSAKYPLEITPDGWAFSIWLVIYIFQTIWIIYTVANICRKVQGSPAYVTPAVLTSAFFLVFMLSSVANIVWLFLWDRELLMVAAPVLVMQTVACQAGLLIGYNNLDKNISEMGNQGRMTEVTFIRIFVFNGLGMYGTWTTIASLINVGTVLAYKMDRPFSQDFTAIVCLSMLALFFIIFAVLDVTVLERYSRFTFSPYLVLLWALAAIMSKNWNPEQTSSIFVAVLTAVAAMGLVLKLVVSYWYQRQNSAAYKTL